MTIPNPSHPFEVTKDYGLLVSDPTAGPILRGRRRPNIVRTFRFPVRLMTQTEADSVLTDHDTQKGRAGNFSYTPTALGEGATTVRFSQDTLDTTFHGGPAGHEMDIVLEEDMQPI